MNTKLYSVLRAILFIVWGMSTIACSRKVQPILACPRLQERGIDTSLILTKDTTLQYDSLMGKQIALKYLGCGGFYIVNGQTAILIDPFFSQAPALGVPFKIGTNTEDVQFGLEDIRSNIHDKVNGIFITHSHFDHLRDVPHIFHCYIDTSKSDFGIHGSQSMANILGSMINSEYIKTVDDNLSDQDRILQKVGFQWVMDLSGFYRFSQVMLHILNFLAYLFILHISLPSPYPNFLHIQRECQDLNGKVIKHYHF